MTAGDDLAGESLAGEDDVVGEVEPSRVRTVAYSFDGTTRDFPLDDDGHYVAIHAVDSAMQMALLVAKDAIGSSPTTGSGLRSIKYLNPRRIGNEVRDKVRLATAAIVARGDVTIDAINHETTQAGGLLVVVDYFNERLPGRPRKTVSA